jgi:hypothetical protein
MYIPQALADTPGDTTCGHVAATVNPSTKEWGTSGTMHHFSGRSESAWQPSDEQRVFWDFAQCFEFKESPFCSAAFAGVSPTVSPHPGMRVPSLLPSRVIQVCNRANIVRIVEYYH